MKRLILAGLVIFFLGGNIAYAQLWKRQPGQTSVVQKTAVAGAQAEALLAEKKAALNGTEWTVTMTPAGGKGRVETDVLSFSDDKVVSKNLAARGFAASNYSVRLQDDGALTWETMQTSEKEGLAFWRGDVNEGIMRGVLSKRDKNEATTDFSFVSTGMTAAQMPAETIVVTTK